MKQHGQRFLTLVAESKKNIKELSPQALKEKIDNHYPMVIVDVREADEWSKGAIASAIHLSRGIIERDIEKTIPDVHQELVVYCSVGFRCALVAESLQKMGYERVSSLESGLQGWLDAGYSLTAPE